MCVKDGCITLPRHIETVLSYTLDDRPGFVRNEWFEFLPGGPGLIDPDQGWSLNLIHTDWVVAFESIIGTDKKIEVVSDETESGTPQILLQGWDENNEWIRTLSGGSWIDGELVDITTSKVKTQNKFTSLTGVQKPETNGTIHLYEFDTSDSSRRVIAVYEPDERNPEYRRIKIPGLEAGTDCEANNKVVIQAKLRYMPVSKDRDWLLIGNEPALKDMVQSIRFAENNLLDQSVAYEQRAIRELEKEMQSIQGDGTVQPPRFAPASIYGGGGIENVV